MNWGLLAAIYSMFHVAHGIGDYWVQTDWQAQFKSTNSVALVRHILTYSICFIPISIILYKTGEISSMKALLLPIVVGLPHAWMDRRKFINWFTRTTKNWNSSDNLSPVASMMRMFVTIEMDQKFHYLCLLLTSFWLANK